MTDVTGHQKLILDLKELFSKAANYHYHDFKTELATPKIQLVRDLTDIADKAKQGEYDNRPKDDQ